MQSFHDSDTQTADEDGSFEPRPAPKRNQPAPRAAAR